MQDPSGAPGDGAIDDAPSPATVEQAALIFKALSDPLRIRLVAMTRAAGAGGICFCTIADQVDMPQSSLSHHLRVLVDAGILDRERRGTWSWYRLRGEPFEVLQTTLRPGGALVPSVECAEDEAADAEASPGHHHTA